MAGKDANSSLTITKSRKKNLWLPFTVEEHQVTPGEVRGRLLYRNYASISKKTKKCKPDTIANIFPNSQNVSELQPQSTRKSQE